MTSVFAAVGNIGLPIEVLTAETLRADMHGEQGVAFTFQHLPTDAIGTKNLTLSNVVVGSRINIRDQADTVTLYDALAATSTVVIPLSVYAGGSVLNNWRIKVRNASGSPAYVPYETLMTATVGSSSIYVSQIPDE